MLVKALRGSSVAPATVAATAAVVIVAGVGIHARLGIEITNLTQDILVLLHIADLRLRVRQLGTKLIQILRLDQIASQLILLDDGRLDVAAARLHLGTQLIEGKLTGITVLKNLLLSRAILTMAELSDVLMMKALEDDNNDDTWGSAGFLWVILIFLFFLAFSGGGLFGNRGNGPAVVANDLSQVERDVLTGNSPNKNIISTQ